MNPLEVMILIFSGLLILTLTVTFIDELISIRVKTSNEVDLLNVINIYQRGLSRNSSFSASYTPLMNGTLVITEEQIVLNNASRPNPGLDPVNCEFDYLIISDGGVECLKA